LSLGSFQLSYFHPYHITSYRKGPFDLELYVELVVEFRCFPSLW